MSASYPKDIEVFSREVCRLVQAGEFVEAKCVIEHLLLITGSSEVDAGEREFHELLMAAGEESRKKGLEENRTASMLDVVEQTIDAAGDFGGKVPVLNAVAENVTFFLDLVQAAPKNGDN